MVLILCGFGAYLSFKGVPLSELFLTKEGSSSQVIIEGKSFTVRLARTTEEQQLGLGNVPSMPKDEGMLFIFPTVEYHSFWMKDTLIPLDIIWIGEDFTIIHIEHNVQPESYPEIFTPNTPSLYVLELNGGISKKYNFERGKKIELNLQNDVDTID